ncbi:MAG: hypothetical protein Q9180_009474 [Flavoplaca navasiana]
MYNLPTADDGPSEPTKYKPDTATADDDVAIVDAPGSTDPDAPIEANATQDSTVKGKGTADVSGNEGSDSEGDSSTTASEGNRSSRSRNRHNLKSHKERRAAERLTLVEQRERKHRAYADV